MQEVPRPLLVLHDDPGLRQTLRALASEQGLQLAFVGDWASLHDRVRSAPASALVLVDPFPAGGTPGMPDDFVEDVGRLVEQFPSLTLTAATDVHRGREQGIRRLGEVGVIELVDLTEENSVAAIGHRLRSTRGRRLRLLIERALPARMPGLARSILAAAAAVVAEGGQGSDLADALNVTTRTLSRWCRRAALPPPKRLLAWMRVLSAADLIDDPGRTIADVAASCGYAADTSLRHALRAFLGKSPRELREAGAFAAAAAAFVAALEEARAQETRYRKRRTAST